jgi:hypothetical protein
VFLFLLVVDDAVFLFFFVLVFLGCFLHHLE